MTSGSRDPLFNINMPIRKIYNQDMNALGYSLYLGHTEAFAIILELGRAKLSLMSKLYLPLNKRPIDIICELGHRKLLEFYLPFYLNKSDEIENGEEESISLSFTRSKNMKSLERSKNFYCIGSLTPLQHACDKGKLGIVQFVFEHFAGRTPPAEFDVHYQEETTGENCALVACRTGMVEMIQYLYEKCSADFHVLNKRNESSLQVLAVWSKKRKQKRFLPCFQYLVEVVGVDLKYEAEETLLVLEDRDIVEYLEGKLRNEGVSISKGRVDDKYSLSKGRVPPVLDPALENKLSKIKGNKFNFQEIFKEELEESNEVNISSIEVDQSVPNLSQMTFLEEKL
jgi:hypothetical protein